MKMSHPGTQASAALPEPDAAAQAHSARVTARLRREIEAGGGHITFARYMQLALYEPGLGYYSAGSYKFGPAGDFITAPELSPLFSRCVARQCEQVLQACGGDILEFGAGSGAMARDVLAALEAAGRLPGRYLIVEVSGELRERQRAALTAAVPHLADRVRWLDAPPESGFTGVMLANEVLDAFPVHRFSIGADGRAREDYVTWDGAAFAWRSGPLSDAAVGRALAAMDAAIGLASLGTGYRAEIGLLAGAWINAAARTLSRGLLLIIDYGFPRAEYYHPQRRDGTLMCHYRHRAHADPFLWPGLQDITAHVDFTAVAEAAVAADLAVAGYTNQANFLLATGLEDAVAADADPAALLAVAQQIRRLTLPQGMGELFKAMALTRGLDVAPRGFRLRDYRGRL